MWFGHWISQERGQNRDPVKVLRDFGAGEFREGWEHVHEGNDLGADFSGRNGLGPSCDEGNTDAAFGEVTFVPTRRTVGVETFVGGFVAAIVAAEYEEGVAGEAQFIDEVDDPTGIAVEQGDHSGVLL